MFHVPDHPLLQATVDYLVNRQEQIDKLPTLHEQTASAKKLWNSKNSGKAGKAAITDIRRALARMAGALERCMYCEDSAADEIEHHHPKDLYPKLTFVWSNHLFACGPCNGPKNNKFAVVRTDNGVLIDVQEAAKASVAIPAATISALIDPRRDNPLDYLWLDVSDTFEFVPASAPGTIEYARAEYTINVLRLNIRDVLVAARRNAYSGFQARLFKYATQKQKKAPPETLERAKAELLAAPHLTVWHEMQRQQGTIPYLSALFGQAPEALGWKRG